MDDLPAAGAPDAQTRPRSVLSMTSVEYRAVIEIN